MGKYLTKTGEHTKAPLPEGASINEDYIDGELVARSIHLPGPPPVLLDEWRTADTR